MIFIWGTYYLNKKRLEERIDICQFCGKKSSLGSFTGYKFGHLYYIPVLPLGRKVVFDYCLKCDRLYEMPYAKWLKYKDEQLEQTREAYLANKSNPENAIDYHSALLMNHLENEARDLAKQMQHNFPDTLSVIEYLLCYYSSEGDSRTTEHLAFRLNALKPENELAKQALIDVFMDNQEFDRAKKEILSLEKPDNIYDYANMLTLAYTFYNQNRKRDAYDVFTFISKKLPWKVNGNKKTIKIIARLEKELNVTQSILQKKYRPIRTAAIVSVLVAIVVGTVYVFYYRYTNFLDLYIINGFNQKVSIKTEDSGKAISIGPRSLKIETLKKGKQKMAVTLPNGKSWVTELDLSAIDSGNLLRAAPVCVYNIKGAALLIKEDVEYYFKGEPGNDTKQNKYQIYTGSTFHTFKNIDFAFEEAPEVISEPDKKVQVQLTLLKEDELSSLSVLLKHFDRIEAESFLRFMEAHIESGYRNPDFLEIYKTACRKLQARERSKAFLTSL